MRPGEWGSTSKPKSPVRLPGILSIPKAPESRRERNKYSKLFSISQETGYSNTPRVKQETFKSPRVSGTERTLKPTISTNPKTGILKNPISQTKGLKYASLCMQISSPTLCKITPPEKGNTQTSIPLLFHPPGPLHAHNHNPQAIHTLTAIAQNVGA